MPWLGVVVRMRGEVEIKLGMIYAVLIPQYGNFGNLRSGQLHDTTVITSYTLARRCQALNWGCLYLAVTSQSLRRVLCVTPSC